MLFNSLQFLIFFPVVTTLYFILPHKYRWALLLIASCVFYMFFIPAYILILAVTILIDYFAGIYIAKSEGKKKKLFLIISIISTCLVLAIFKYFNFFNSNIVLIADFFNWNYSIPALKLLLPVGLSFHTFQSLSYVIEVYKGRQKVESNFGIYALYVMFYPQLVAGPIERPQNLLHQFYEKHDFDYERVINGLKLMAWGMFKKIVIADRIAPFVYKVYNNPENFKGLALIIATVLFAIQIYCDFSGYSDIAIGSAKVMGFKLMQNFNRPYFSKSITEFWQRWHISLSTWFRDYLYIPLGGNKVKVPRYLLNLFITFLVSGLWHGASWTFVIWGAIHGIYIIIEKLIEKYGNNMIRKAAEKRSNLIIRIIGIILTFSLVTFSWIFFRANNISDALYIVKNLFYNFNGWFNVEYIKNTVSSIDLKSYEFLKVLIAISVLFIVELIQRKTSIIKFINLKPIVVRWGIYIFFIIAMLFFKSFQNQQFIYFQF